MKNFLLAALIALCGVSFGFGYPGECCYKCMQEDNTEKSCIERCHEACDQLSVATPVPAPEEAPAVDGVPEDLIEKAE